MFPCGDFTYTSVWLTPHPHCSLSSPCPAFPAVCLSPQRTPLLFALPSNPPLTIWTPFQLPGLSRCLVPPGYIHVTETRTATCQNMFYLSFWAWIASFKIFSSSVYFPTDFNSLHGWIKFHCIFFKVICKDFNSQGRELGVESSQTSFYKWGNWFKRQNGLFKEEHVKVVKAEGRWPSRYGALCHTRAWTRLYSFVG